MAEEETKGRYVSNMRRSHVFGWCFSSSACTFIRFITYRPGTITFCTHLFFVSLVTSTVMLVQTWSFRIVEKSSRGQIKVGYRIWSLIHLSVDLFEGQNTWFEKMSFGSEFPFCSLHSTANILCTVHTLSICILRYCCILVKEGPLFGDCLFYAVKDNWKKRNLKTYDDDIFR